MTSEDEDTSRRVSDVPRRRRESSSAEDIAGDSDDGYEGKHYFKRSSPSRGEKDHDRDRDSRVKDRDLIDRELRGSSSHHHRSRRSAYYPSSSSSHHHHHHHGSESPNLSDADDSARPSLKRSSADRHGSASPRRDYSPEADPDTHHRPVKRRREESYTGSPSERYHRNGASPTRRYTSDDEDRRSPSPYRSRRYYGGRDRYRDYRDASPSSGGRRTHHYSSSRPSRYYYGGRRRDYDDDDDRRRNDERSRRSGAGSGGDGSVKGDEKRVTEPESGTKAPSQPLTEEERKRKEVEDARRDDLTVLVVNLSLKATEKDIWQFFTKHAGKVRDIQLIKDARSGKSKGIGYVEFHDAESVLKSLNLTGQCVLNQPIRVQASQAEKNRAAKAAKQQQAELAAQGPTKIYVGGLVDTLAGITSDELRQLFSPFGSILQIDIPKDPYTGRGRGYAFVQFKTAGEAREAMTAMHGFEIGGKQIKVGFAGEEQRTTSTSSTVDGSNGVDLDKIADDHDDRLLHGGAMTRLQLSQKLQQKSSDRIPLLSSAAAAQLMSAADIQATIQSVSTKPTVTPILSLANMFTKQEIMEEGIDMVDEVLDDVKNECNRFGEVADIWVNREVLDGKILVKFRDVQNATAAFQGLNGRFFGGSAIVVTYITEEQWQNEVLS